MVNVKFAGSVYYVFLLIISFADILFYFSIRPVWKIIDKTINTRIGTNFSWGWIFAVLTCLAFTYVLSIWFDSFFIRHQVPTLLHNILPAVPVLFFTAMNIVVYTQLGTNKKLISINMVSALPLFLVAALAIFFILIFPSLKMSHNIIFRVAALALLIISIILYRVDFGNVKITSGPLIQYVDGSNIAVTWTTDRDSTGFVEYGPDEQHLKKAYASSNGMYEATTKLHRVILNTENSSGFIYRIGSTKLVNYFASAMEYGNTVYSDYKRFTDIRNKSDITFIMLNDIHNNSELYRKFLTGSDYDFLILGGDSVSAIDNIDYIIEDMIEPLGRYTNGSKPVYIVRGNHESKGGAQGELINYFVFPGNKYYYTFDAGPMHAIVLDSGEDREDSYEEYGGLAAFNEYREEEYGWLEKLNETRELYKDKYTVAFVHIPLNAYKSSSPLSEYQKKWTDSLNRMGVKAAFSGHTHNTRLIKPDNNYKFPTFVSGGGADNVKYTAAKVNISNGKMTVQYINLDGKVVNEYKY